MEQAIAIGGVLIGLTFFDYRIALVCSLILVPLFFIQRLYGGRVLALQTEVHDRLETGLDTLLGQSPEAVRAYYMEVANPQQRIANWGAASFGLIRVVLLLVFLGVLFVALDLDDFTTGRLYSIVAYLWTFVTAAEYLPELMEGWIEVRDLSQRLHTEGSPS